MDHAISPEPDCPSIQTYKARSMDSIGCAIYLEPNRPSPRTHMAQWAGSAIRPELDRPPEPARLAEKCQRAQPTSAFCLINASVLEVGLCCMY